MGNGDIFERQGLSKDMKVTIAPYINQQSKKGYIFVNEKGEQLSLEWFNERINHYAKIMGIQKIKKYYADGRTLKLITCMALREAGGVTTTMPEEAGNYQQ